METIQFLRNVYKKGCTSEINEINALSLERMKNKKIIV